MLMNTLCMVYMAGTHGREGRAFALLDSCDGKLQKLATSLPHLFHLHTTSLDPNKGVSEVAKCIPMVGSHPNWKNMERFKESKLPQISALATKQDGFIFSRQLCGIPCFFQAAWS